MKRLILSGLVCLGGLSAAASESAFETAVQSGSWQGCVYEDGDTPYPIRLTARGEDFFVSYPELDCIGGHNAGLKPDGFDAMEVIVLNTARRCATNLPLRYTLRPDGLRIDYFAGAAGTYALLHPVLPGMPAPECDLPDAVS
jgi:hypothetical protein